MQNLIFQIIKPQVLEIRDLQVKGEEETAWRYALSQHRQSRQCLLTVLQVMVVSVKSDN